MRRHLLALALLGSVGARLGEPEFSCSYTEGPSAAPTTETRAPTRTESYAPTRTTEAPSYAPTTDTYAPTRAPTLSHAPTAELEGGSGFNFGFTLTRAPTADPSAAPTAAPTSAPSPPQAGSTSTTKVVSTTTKVFSTTTKLIAPAPTPSPSSRPTPSPTAAPSPGPTSSPTAQPTTGPTSEPTGEPTSEPTPAPTATPTAQPTSAPTAEPTSKPTAAPTVAPTAQPTSAPTAEPTTSPTPGPTPPPTPGPTPQPSPGPTPQPTPGPTVVPTATPTAPTSSPTAEPTSEPTAEPTAGPTPAPTAVPTAQPTPAPTGEPTAEPSPRPTTPEPSASPTLEPTVSFAPSSFPSAVPTQAPTNCAYILFENWKCAAFTGGDDGDGVLGTEFATADECVVAAREARCRRFDFVNDADSSDFGQCRCCVANGDLSHALTPMPVTARRRVQEAPQGTVDPGVQPFDCAAHQLPLQVLKESGSSCPTGTDQKPCQQFRVAKLNLATGAYDELGPGWYLTDVIGDVEINAAAMHEDANGDNYIYAVVKEPVVDGVAQGNVLVRLDDSSMKVVATLSMWTYSAAIVRDTFYYGPGAFGNRVYVVKDIQTANPVVDNTKLVSMKTSLWTGGMADVAGIEEEQDVEVIDDDHLNGQYLIGLSRNMEYIVVMRINDEGGASDGLVDRYAVITNTVDWGPGPPQGPGAPENFVWKTSKSGFGAAYAYVDTNGTQRAFVSANEARPENTKYSWGLFEIELPIVVPDECWNMGLNTVNHNWCRNIVGQPQDQPAKVTWRMHTAPTNQNDGMNCRRAEVSQISETAPPTIYGSFSEDPTYDVYDASRCFDDPTAVPTLQPTTTPVLP